MIPKIDTFSIDSATETELLKNGFSKENDMIPLTLVSGSNEELQECMDASPLERIFFAISFTVMHLVSH